MRYGGLGVVSDAMSVSPSPIFSRNAVQLPLGRYLTSDVADSPAAKQLCEHSARNLAFDRGCRSIKVPALTGSGRAPAKDLREVRGSPLKNAIARGRAVSLAVG